MNLIKLYCFWLVSILAIALISFTIFPGHNNLANFFQSFGNWDGGNFLRIAKFGYFDKNLYAFFPLFPILIALVSGGLFITPFLAGLILNLIFSFLSLLFFEKLLRLDYSREKSFQILTDFLIFPTSFFLICIYSESLFLFLSLAAFYFLRKQKFILVFIFVFFAVLTRITGIALVLAVFYEAIHLKNKRKDKWIIFLAPIGFLFYLVFQYAQTGNPFYFLVSESYWHRSLSFPGIAIWNTLIELFSKSPFNFSLLLDLLFTIFGIGMVIRTIRFLKPSYAVFAVVSIAIPLLTPTLLSMPRFLLLIFPIFIVAFRLKNIYFQALFKVFSVVLLCVYISLFINGYWAS